MFLLGSPTLSLSLCISVEWGVMIYQSSESFLKMAQKGLQDGSSSAHLGVGYERKTDMDEDSSTSSLMIMEEGNRNYYSYNCYSPDLWGGIQFERGGLPCHAAATASEEQQQGHKSRNSRHNNVGPLDPQLPSETTATSSSGGSISKADQPKPFKESETQNEKRQEDSGENFKKSSGCSSKRSRAAEVHNLSEKRRRNRINEKMKALQNLIPNSNKTDKASMLDEAIDYLKKLQLQVQMLSARSGIDISSMRWLSQMPQLQIQQQQPVPSTCMGNRAQAAGPVSVSVPEIGFFNNQSGERRSSLSAMEHHHHYETAVDISTSSNPDNEMQEWIQTSCKLGSQQSAFPLPQLPATTQGVHSAIPLRDNKI